VTGGSSRPRRRRPARRTRAHGEREARAEREPHRVPDGGPGRGRPSRGGARCRRHRRLARALTRAVRADSARSLREAARPLGHPPFRPTPSVASRTHVPTTTSTFANALDRPAAAPSRRRSVLSGPVPAGLARRAHARPGRGRGVRDPARRGAVRPAFKRSRVPAVSARDAPAPPTAPPPVAGAPPRRRGRAATAMRRTRGAPSVTPARTHERAPKLTRAAGRGPAAPPPALGAGGGRPIGRLTRRWRGPARRAPGRTPHRPSPDTPTGRCA
jgi:hypothetical protein